MGKADISQLVADRVWNSQQFQKERTLIQEASIRFALMGDRPADVLSEEVALRLLQSAVFLAASDKPSYRQSAYRIAVSLFNLYREQFDSLPKLLHVILARLGNFPTIEHLYRTLERPRDYELPSGVLYDLIDHELANTLTVGKKDILLTDFQRGVWGALTGSQVISVTAPTSAGKSFLLQQYLVSRMTEGRDRLLLYLVPTRALISQVADALASAFPKTTKGIPVSTIPASRTELDMQRRPIYVLTQERTHVLMEADPEISFDIVVIDEAQTIGAGARGILLQAVIENLIGRCPHAQFFFGFLSSENPSYFSCLFDRDIETINYTESPVSQNLVSLEVPADSTHMVNIRLLGRGTERR